MPLIFGGLGWRGMVVREEEHSQITRYRNVSDFSKLIACQGLGWPDADILENAGFRVIRIARFDTMFELLVKRRCDYIPLSIFEGKAELSGIASQYPGLVFSYEPIIRYDLKMFFYVSPDKASLANALFQALSEMRDNGELLAFAKHHTLTRDAFPLSRYRHFIDIDSP